MDPLYCQRDKAMDAYGNSTYVCVIRQGFSYFYPTFNHVGSNLSTPTYCQCGDFTEFQQQVCNQFNFIPSLLFFQWNESYANQSEHDLIHFSILNGVSGVENNRLAYEAAYDAVVETEFRNNTTWRESAYDFCSQNTTQGCSLYTIMLADLTSHAVSDYYYQAIYLICL
jgi:hypothetical protein